MVSPPRPPQIFNAGIFNPGRKITATIRTPLSICISDHREVIDSRFAAEGGLSFLISRLTAKPSRWVLPLWADVVPPAFEAFLSQGSKTFSIATGVHGSRTLELRSFMPNVEVFLAVTKEKLVGSLGVPSPTDQIFYQGTDGSQRFFDPNDLVAVRPRGQNLNSIYIHPRLTQPQFFDKSINKSGGSGDGKWVLIDFAEPEFQAYVDRHTRIVRKRLNNHEITPEEAARAVFDKLVSATQYDTDRSEGHHLPNHLYSIAEFLRSGVCNEQAMLLQLIFQYLGIESRMEKGSFMKGRHAWVRATDSRLGQTMIFDPAQQKIYNQSDKGFIFYRDDDTPFAVKSVPTVIPDFG